MYYICGENNLSDINYSRTKKHLYDKSELKRKLSFTRLQLMIVTVLVLLGIYSVSIIIVFMIEKADINMLISMLKYGGKEFGIFNLIILIFIFLVAYIRDTIRINSLECYCSCSIVRELRHFGTRMGNSGPTILVYEYVVQEIYSGIEFTIYITENKVLTQETLVRGTRIKVPIYNKEVSYFSFEPLFYLEDISKYRGLKVMYRRLS